MGQTKESLNLGQYKAFVFDLDGTLLDSGTYHARAFAEVVKEQSGYLLTPEEHREVFASHSTAFCPVLNARHGLSLDPEKILTAKRQRVKELFEVKLFEGAVEFLERWKGRCRFGLATNSPEGFVAPALEDAGLRKYFDAIVTASDVHRRKPDPEIFQIAFQRLGVLPEETLVFEDQRIGVESAEAAGAKVIAVDNQQMVDFPPNIPVRTWKELLEE